MRLIHQDGRTQIVPDRAYRRHEETYTRAGWRLHPDQRTDAQTVAAIEGVRIRSRHGEERTVSEADFAETFAPAGWTLAADTSNDTENGDATSEAADGADETNAPQRAPRRARR